MQQTATRFSTREAPFGMQGEVEKLCSMDQGIEASTDADCKHNEQSHSQIGGSNDTKHSDLMQQIETRFESIIATYSSSRQYGG